MTGKEQIKNPRRRDRFGHIQSVQFDIIILMLHVETVCCLYHQKKDFISVPYEPKDASYLKQS
mgnify:CR=1 FL=1